MNIKKRFLSKEFVKSIIYIIFIVFFIWPVLRSEEQLFRIVGYVSLFISALLALINLLMPFKDLRFFKQAYLIIEWIFTRVGICFVGLYSVTGPFLILALIILIQLAVLKWLAPNMIFSNLSAYIIGTLTLVLLSYKGVNIIVLYNCFFLDRGKLTDFTNKIMIRILSKLDFRRRAYELSIIMYVLSSIETLLGKKIITWSIWNSFSQASLAILLTFIAIDRYVNSFMPEVIQNQKHKIKAILETL